MSTELKPHAIGQPLSRVDGRLKVTGAARYPAEFRPPNLACGFLVGSTIAKGAIRSIDVTTAEKAPGVLAVLTHQNVPKLTEPPNAKDSGGIRIEERIPFSDAKINYAGQYIAVIVATTFEEARYAAGLLRVDYEVERFALTKEDAPDTAKQPEESIGEKLQQRKGEIAAALAKPDLVKIEETYSTPTETHNPMECSATIAEWPDAQHLVLYDATQYVKGAQAVVAQAFNLPRENVRIICPFVGGAFGCKGPVWPHTIAAAMAALVVKRPVRIEVTRQLMFSGTGHRPPTFQTIALAASRDGKLQAIRHKSEMLTSPVGAWVEACGIGSTNVLYDAPAIEFSHTVYTVNVSQPSFMRAPGECPGTYAAECAMDELAYALGMDPLQLRLVNDSPNHPLKGVPWSTKHLRECYEVGAERFGWNKRQHAPGSMKDGRLSIGWGMATATYPAKKWDADVHIQLHAGGKTIVKCASHDLGTGAYTAFTQISADAIGVPVEDVVFELGSSDFPYGPVAGGSNSTATVGSAIVAAAQKLHEKLAGLALADKESPLAGAEAKKIALVGARRLGDGSKSVSFDDILHGAGLKSIEAQGGIKEEENKKLGFQSFGAHFCEVNVDPELLSVRVSRFVSVMDCGRVINPKTGGSQILGGVVMGIGMALEEHTVYDRQTGLPATRNLADYHVPVNADIPAIEVHFVGEPDFAFNPMGSRGMGEIGITGAAAAVANAVFHATGKRVRDLPITLDKLLV
ncbi:aldehyde oxidase and xanthine dehydrogenase molybdopterin binding [Chthoniobacter flavus Ellin428]|uniref:Aldehyde oxidase and xanthine dehydrogenase molybdopterin binding n=1 Tax=Chthoniobacter flavus Ellin428 TaxID=497964 RepID=B4CX87_9BACT|nr:xanthine dehydrogenase family protein molybdopterin-binding subunit [Chthoniobacter flavus]EDY20885.1 aldehyde oxidase and xanthine dehydrogenase molybdopterin binding [Chthoniobacter flavus Ellin428]TCO85627.1 xanthine dehydrogenase YagR molybdenum-binding subunit [Chthoniobacter flavus]